jgi:hypothetical protein
VTVRGGDSAGHIAFLDHVDSIKAARHGVRDRVERFQPTLDPGVKIGSRLHPRVVVRRDAIKSRRTGATSVALIS